MPFLLHCGLNVQQQSCFDNLSDSSMASGVNHTAYKQYFFFLESRQGAYPPPSLWTWCSDFVLPGTKYTYMRLSPYDEGGIDT